MKLSIYSILLTCLVLTACAKLEPAPVPDVPSTALFSDEAIDSATLQLASETVSVTADSSMKAVQQLQTANGSGYLYFVDRIATAHLPWRVFRLEPSSSEKVLVYEGKREVQSVAGSLDGESLVLSIRNKTSFDIYQLQLSSAKVYQLTDTPEQEINVSMDASAQTLIWETQAAQHSRIEGRRYDSFPQSFLQFYFEQGKPQSYPSLSGNGRYLALLQEAQGMKEILVFDFETYSYRSVIQGRETYRHPSVSDDGQAVLWLMARGAKSQLKYRFADDKPITLLSGRLEHPFLSADGQSLLYGFQTGNQWQLVSSQLDGSQKTALGMAAPKAMFWQKPVEPLPASDPQKIFPADGATYDGFGQAVAIDGNTAVVGAYKHDAATWDAGAAYVLERSTSSWSIVKKLLPPDGAYADFFGYDVDISGDTLVVGAYWDDDRGESSGSVYVFERDEGGADHWGLRQKLLASDGGMFDNFGKALAMDGNTLVVGAPQHHFLEVKGAAYVFEKDSSGTWQETAKLLASDGEAGDLFGSAVAVSGTRVLIGAYQDDDKGSSAGAAYLFERSTTGNWNETKLTASDGAADDLFGYALDMDGDTLAISAYQDDDKGKESGSVYVFDLAAGSLSETKLLLNDGTEGDRAGFSLALDEDQLLIGAFGDDDVASLAGAAYRLQRAEAGWLEQQKMTLSESQAGDLFGWSVALSGSDLLIAAPLDDAIGDASGAVYFVK